MPEGLQAGRLEVTVVSVLDGFARELRTKVEAAAEGLAVKVKVEVDSKGLRRRLKNAVKEASKGLTAKVKVKVDRDGVRGELEEVARQAASTDVRVPVRPDGDGGGGRSGGLLGRLRNLLSGAQSEADQNPVTVPFQLGDGGGGGRRRGRGRLRSLALGAIVSLAQPAIAAITQYGFALTALVSAAAPAVGVLGAIPGLLVGIGTAAVATKVAFGGVGEALKQTLRAQAQLADGSKLTKAQQNALNQSLKGLSTSARASVKTVASLSGEWRKMRQSVQERFFSKVANEIKPLSSAVLPLLKSSLGDAAGQMGNLAKRGAQAVRSGPFASGFKKVAATNSKVIGNVSNGVANLAAATGHFLVASGPFVERIGKGAEGFTRWIRASAQAGRETGSLERFLDHAAEKAKQLGRTTLLAGKGLAGIGRAGQDAGNALLDGLEGTMLRFSRWANSAKGQAGIKQFFSDAAPTFHELNKLVGDFFRGLARMAKDNGIRDLIGQIRTELMPAVGKALDVIGSTVGPTIIGLVSNIASLFATLSSAGVGLGTLLGAFNGLLTLLNGLMNVVPGLGTSLGVLLGAFLAFRMLSSIVGLLQRLGTGIRSIGTASSVAAGAVGPQISLWQRMSGAYTTAAASGGRLTGMMRGVGSAAGVMRGAMGGLLGALGGPWGAAITAVTIGIGLLANQHEKAARAAEAQKSRITTLTQALRDSNGAIDANVRAQAVQLLQEAKLGDTKIVDKLRGVGVSLTQLTDLYLSQGKGLSQLEQKLRSLADAKQEYIEKGRDVFVKGDGEESKRYRDAADALKSVNGELTESMRNAREGAAAMNGAGNKGVDSFTRLKTAVDGMSNSTATADSRVDQLKRAIDALTGGTQSFHDAQTRVNAAILSVNDAIAANTSELKNANKELINQDGSLRTATRAGQDYNSHLTELRDSALGAANAAFEMAKANDMSLPEAMKKAEGEVQRARDAAIKYGVDLGLTKNQAAGLANQMGLIPSSVSILLQANGMDKATADILSLSTQLLNLPTDKTVTVKAPTDTAIYALRNLGFEVVRMPGNKQVTVRALTDSARTNLQALMADLARTPGDKKVTIQTLVKQAAADLTGIRDKVVSLPPGKKVDVQAPTKLAQQELRDLGYKIRDLKDKKRIEITAPNATPLAQVQRIQDRINSLTGKTVHVTVQYSESGKPSVVSNHANGSILRFAGGGIRRASDRVRAFANGVERHIAQIAQPGEWRLWAEPETGGEAYIPLSPSKRKRSEAILDQVARMFGGRVVYFANGALRQQAQGAVSLHRGSGAASPAASTPQRGTVPAPSALIGGDLNLTMTGAPMSPSDALNSAMYELRRIRRGGAYVAAG
ncbi:hypothetical protein [Streptomyces chrestomyceticus]|uniref:hypothetical protein n=1 Tax=Streptomyces chrestomyceticus TaxID=68185 RepID=UPI0034009606